MARDADTPLGSLVALRRGVTYQSSMLGKPGPFLLGLGSIARNGGFRAENLKTYGGESDPRTILGPGDIYVSLKDVTQSADLLGAVARVPDFVLQGRLTQDTVKLEFIKPGTVTEYIYWILRTPQYREYCRAHATGTTNLGLPREDFLSYPIPPLTSSRQMILELLELVESKIEINRRTNETLEATAHALFKDWFVDFGPTRAKLESREPYLAADVWRQFPSRMDDLGRPEGWPDRRIGDIMELAYGKSLTAKDRIDGCVPVYGSGGIAGYHNEAMVFEPSIIIGRKGTIGSLYWEDRPFFPIDTVFFVTSGVPLTYCYYLLQTLRLESMNTDAAVPGLNRNNVYRLRVPWGGDGIVARFDEIVKTIRAQITHYNEESATLATVRDFLLLRLIPGEICTRDAAEDHGGLA